jgi:hypothetical protein
MASACPSDQSTGGLGSCKFLDLDLVGLLPCQHVYTLVASVAAVTLYPSPIDLAHGIELGKFLPELPVRHPTSFHRAPAS